MKDDVMKITAAYCLLSNTPEGSILTLFIYLFIINFLGADQVTIAKIVYKLACIYNDTSPGESQISFSKVS